MSAAACPTPERPVLYIGADSIHTPLQHGTTCEAKVGVLFWQNDHWRLSKTRSGVRKREYVATLETVVTWVNEKKRGQAGIVSLYQKSCQREEPLK